MKRRDFLAGVTTALLPLPAFAETREKEVLAFYYGWYGTPARSGSYRHWQTPDLAHHLIADAPDYPVEGPYDSLDDAVIARHVAQAADSGITGLIASWWGQADQTDQQLIGLLAATAEPNLKVSAYIEQAATVETLIADILYIYHNYAGHSSWLKLDGKPVIFLFDRVLQILGLDGWAQARKQIESAAPGAIAFVGTANSLKEIQARRTYFDVVHIYSMQFEAAEKRWSPPLWRDAFYRDWVRAQSGSKATTATVLPGFDDSRLPDRAGKRPIVDRADGRAYGRLWRAAIRARPDWVLIVSFNEWHEASQIEPSLEYGERELATTKTMSAQFLAS